VKERREKEEFIGVEFFREEVKSGAPFSYLNKIHEQRVIFYTDKSPQSQEYTLSSFLLAPLSPL